MPPGSTGLTPDQVLAAVREAVGIVLELDPAAVLPGQRLTQDLGADSLAIVEIVEVVEAALALRRPGFAVPDEDLEDFETVQELADHCVALL